VSWTRHDAIRTRAFWLITGAIAIQQWAGGAINLHQIPHLVDSGLTPEAAALVISFLAVFGGAGALFEGVLDARIGARWTMVTGLIGSAIGMLILINVSSVPMGLLFAAVYGAAFGMMVTSSQIVFADYFGRESLGAIRGTAAPIYFSLNAAGPLVAGLAHDLTGSYLAAFIPFTISYLVAAAALSMAQKPSPPSRPNPVAVEAAG
jgi:MFS family permease